VPRLTKYERTKKEAISLPTAFKALGWAEPPLVVFGSEAHLSRAFLGHRRGTGGKSLADNELGVVVHPAMENPTLVCLTDRNDLDDQLFGQFARCAELLRQNPMQAEGVAHLRELSKVASGGIVFTTIHKFLPEKRGPARGDALRPAQHRGHRRRV
jgi:hypothetical protein